MKATFIRTEGPGRKAILKIDGCDYCVRDGFSWSTKYAGGDELDVELSAELDRSWSWEKIFASNPDRRIGLELLDGWSYLARGQIASIDPVRIDCGVFVEERAVVTHDPE